MIVANISVAGSQVVQEPDPLHTIHQFVQDGRHIFMEILFMTLVVIMDVLKYGRASDEFDNPDIVARSIEFGVAVHKSAVVADQFQDFGFFVGTAIAAYFEDSDVDIEFLVEDRLENHFASVFEVDRAEYPVLGLILNAKPGLVQVALDDIVAATDAQDVAPFDPHAVGGIGDDLGRPDRAPVGDFLDSLLELFYFVHFWYRSSGRHTNRSHRSA
jgi:hypothetical protein